MKKEDFAMIPSLRDSKGGWKHLAAFLHAVFADVLGLYFLLLNLEQQEDSSWMLQLVLVRMIGMMLSAHGRIVASYLIHEAAHSIVFKEEWANETMGLICTWFAGCPYCNFDHIRRMHIIHHKDRTDAVYFDYRDLVQSGGFLVKYTILGLEYVFVPAVETIMHLRCAFLPMLPQQEAGCITISRRQCVSAYIGTPAMTLFYYYLWVHGGVPVLFYQCLMGAFILHFLSFSDSFHHTYEAIFITDPSYKPGSGDRTAQWEDDNTYSNVLSMEYEWLNVLHLNFGYHNAHHKKPMVPWYDLPSYNAKVYSANTNIIPVADVIRPWIEHRLTRILQSDYGMVHPQGTPGRANDFVGALGVSFLTV